jgi:hypothetical protein
MSPDQNAKHIDSLLNLDNAALKKLIKKAKIIQQSGQQLESILDPSFQGHYQLANINQDVATIIAESSAWATRLRYNIPSILDAFNNQMGLKSVRTVRIKIAPVQSTSMTASKKTKQKISHKTASFLKQTAESFSDKELSEIFSRIAQHHLNQN